MLRAVAEHGFHLIIGQLHKSGRFRLAEIDADVYVPYMQGLVAILRARRSQYVALLAKAEVCFQDFSKVSLPVDNLGAPEVVTH